MKKSSKQQRALLLQIYYPVLFILIISMLAVTWHATTILKKMHLQSIAEDLQVRSVLTGDLFLNDVFVKNNKAVDKTCKQYGKMLDFRLTVILPDGTVIGDSDENPQNMDNHGSRPEIRSALSGIPAHSIRFSYTLGKDMIYSAVPLKNNDAVIGVMRTSMPIPEIKITLGRMYRQIAVMGFFVVIAAGLLSLILSRRIINPILEIKRVAEEFGKGKLSRRLHITDSAELTALGNSMNQMAEQLGEHIETITRQRNEMEAVLTSMDESVIAIDTKKQIIRFNKTAEEMFQIDPENSKGRPIHEVIWDKNLIDYVNKFLSCNHNDEEELLHQTKNGDCLLHVRGSLLQNADGNRFGTLLVIKDMTRLKKLENIRKDFVANVSHELKTPITAIKGSVETLKDGAMHHPDDSKRFLDITLKHVNRLNAIVDDLLNLSRIEESEKSGFKLKPYSIKQILEEAIAICKNKAEEKNIPVHLQSKGNLTARINPRLIEEAVINLIDNSIKYSKPGSPVHIKAVKEKEDIHITIKDQGCGISKVEQSRIFERFYRVDKARSRQLGGTGLGLSIVKHIVMVHQGDITVTSEPDKGSVFTIILPTKKNAVS